MLVLAAASLSGCVVFPGHWFWVTVRHDAPDGYEYRGNLSWSGGQGSIVWDGTPSPQDDAPARGASASHEAYLGSQLQANAANDLGLLPDSDAFVSKPLPIDLHLNVTRGILLELYVKDNGDHPGATATNFASGMSSYPFYYYNYDDRCRVALDVELRMGDTIVAGGTAGQYVEPWWVYGTWSWPATPDGYMLCTYRMAPEVLTLKAGTVLTLTVFHVHEDQPIQYGLAEDHRSQIVFSRYSAEEWAFRDPDQAARSEEFSQGDDAGAGTGFFALFGFALAAGRRRARVAMLALVLVGTAISGCISSNGTKTGTATSDENRGLLDQKLIQGELGNGTIVGVVHDDFHIPIGGVHVSVLNTAAFTTTDGRGRFTFTGLPSGDYVLRFDHRLYRSFESPPVKVKIGFTSRIEVTLYFVNQADIDMRQHSHDYWKGLDRVTVFDADIVPVCDPVDASIRAALLENGCWPRWEWAIPPSPGGEAKTILPGTYDVEVILQWSTQETKLPMLGILVKHNADSAWNRSQYVPRPPNTPFHVRTAWEMTDVGHQTFSTWSFQAYASPRHYPGAIESYKMNQWSLSSMPKLHAKVIIHKGVLSLEPPHPDHWKDRTSYDAGKSTIYLWGCLGISPETNGQLDGCNDFGFAPGSKKIIPWGTKKVEVSVKVTLEASGYDWKFGYRPANKPQQPYGPREWEGYQEVTASRSGTTYKFTIPLKPDEADGIYAKASNFGFVMWASDDNLFYVAYQKDCCPQATATMTAYLD